MADEKQSTPPSAESTREVGHIDIEAATTPDGLKLHPQPTADALDPLNWSKLRKHTILAIVMLK